MSEQQPLKEEHIRVRIPGALKSRIAKAYDNHGVTEATLVRDSLVAILDYIDRAGAYRRPVIMAWQNELAMAAEDAGNHYHTGPGKGGATTSEKPPNKSQRHRGDGPRRAVS